MCLSPIKIRNPTKKISRFGGQKLILEVPCGNCAECVLSTRAEWTFRSYQEVQDTLRKGGFVYFDTLTYNDNSLPKISDYIDINKYGLKDHSCFSHSHFKLFLKNLRRQLNYHHKGVTFKYFLTSEYGEDDRYTHRPHYHILFYILGNICPLEFSRLVSKCWQYGRTDGLPYNNIKYVSEHIYGRNIGFGSNNSIDVITAVCGYVAKYITKSSKFQKELDKRIYRLKQHIDDDLVLKSLIRQVDMFHRQSQGFGCSYLSNADARERELLKENKCLVPDKKHVFVTLPLPMYYKRKMYYTNKKRDDGTRYWELTPDGFKKIVENQLSQVTKEVTNYLDLLKNCNDEQVVDMAYDLLDGRSLHDYVIYDKFYYGRLRNSASVNFFTLSSTPNLDNIEYNLYDWLNVILNSHGNNSMSGLDVFQVRDDGFILLPKSGVNMFYWKSFNSCHGMQFDRFIDKFTFDERVHEFRGFDSLRNLFKHISKNKKQQKQSTFDYVEAYKERLKSNQII